MKKFVKLLIGLFVVSIVFSHPITPNTYANTVSTNIIIRNAKEGENNWYWEYPNVSFHCSEPSATIYYYYNGNKYGARKYTQGSIDYIEECFGSGLQPGKFIIAISYYAQTETSKEETKTFLLKINTINPVVILETPTELLFTTQQPLLQIKGYIVLMKTVNQGKDELVYDASVRIKDTPIPVNEQDGGFQYEYTLEPGWNYVKLVAKDDSGRTEQILLQVYYETDTAVDSSHYSILLDANEFRGWVNGKEITCEIDL